MQSRTKFVEVHLDVESNIFVKQSPAQMADTLFIRGVPCLNEAWPRYLSDFNETRSAYSTSIPSVMQNVRPHSLP